MQIIKCVIQQSDGLCEIGSIMVDRVTPAGELVLADKPMTLKRIGTTRTAGWGRHSDPEARVYGSDEAALKALISQDEAKRVGLA